MFTPATGQLDLEIFDNPRIAASPLLMLTIRFEFLEQTDPDDPNNHKKASCSVDILPMPVDDWRSLGERTFTPEELYREGLTEGAMHYRGYHSPIDITSLGFGEFQEDTVRITLKGVIDFPFEGLAQLGKPEFGWELDVRYDKDHLDSVTADFRAKPE